MRGDSNDPFNKFENLLIRTTASTLLTVAVLKLVWHEIEPLIVGIRVFLGW